MRWNKASTALALTLCSQSFALPLAGAQTPVDEMLCTVQTPLLDIVTVYDSVKRTRDLALSVDVLSRPDLDSIALVHPAEALNGVAGVNIHRGSGQEHLTAIRSPVA